MLDRSERILHLLHACAERPLRSPFDGTRSVDVQTRAEALLHSATTGHQVRTRSPNTGSKLESEVHARWMDEPTQLHEYISTDRYVPHHYPY